jgi:hypothetical protein
MLKRAFHAWERRLVAVSQDRMVRPFEWGSEWTGHVANGGPSDEKAIVARWTSEALRDSDAFFHSTPAPHYEFDRRDEHDGASATVAFESAVKTPHPANNTVYARYFPASGVERPRRAVLVLPQWNADAGGHVGLCQLLARFGLSALRLSMPYHDRRMPSDLSRADYIVSANIARTVQVCRQAVLDARRAIAWLSAEGYERIGILGTSLGSCLSLLTTAHEPLVRAQALNHVSPYFADVVWRGISTAHVRQGLDGHVTLDELRRLWMPISPQYYLERVKDRRTLLVYALYDLTFPLDLSRQLVKDFRLRRIPHEVSVLPCGHYSTGVAPFKYLDGFTLIRFLMKNL